MLNTKIVELNQVSLRSVILITELDVNGLLSMTRIAHNGGESLNKKGIC